MIKKIEKTLDDFFKQENKSKINYKIKRNRNNEFGDFSCNIALVASKSFSLNPMNLGEKIKNYLLQNNFFIDKIIVAKPGFINIFSKNDYHLEVVKNILNLKEKYGKKEFFKTYNLEFVSANPTGFLHIAHARNAALGDSIANIWEHRGIKTIREYYINDDGNQINTLAFSLYERYQELFGKTPNLGGADLYCGSDIIWFAKKIKSQIKDKWVNKKFNDIKEEIKQIAIPFIIKKIKSDLAKLNVYFDIFTSEKDVLASGMVDQLLKTLNGIFKYKGATWLKTSDYGDDKDRVLIKSDGSYTYFLPDIAYHVNKYFKNNVSKIVNIWGADHSGYIKRMSIALELKGYKDIMDVIVLQIVKLIKDGQELKMSKRKGTSFYLEELVEQVGKDTTRFFLVNRSNNSNIDFDLDLAMMKTKDNPVFIVQYAHARAVQLINKSKASKTKIVPYLQENEIDLINLLEFFPDLLENIAINYKVHLLPQYLINLAKKFNSFYSNSKIIGSTREYQSVALVKAFKITIKMGLLLIGVSALNKM